MPQSLSNVYIHLVFSTKHRAPILEESVRPSLHAYITTVLKNLACPVVAINSVPDHIHILFKLSRTLALAKAVEEAKKHSSRWITTETQKEFAWQRGYGAFSVSESGIPAVTQYIGNQEKHHATKSFQNEYRELLTKHRTEFDERYVWD